MKIAIMCRSLLLQKALMIFLKPHISPLKQSDFVICDHKIATNLPQFRLKTPESLLVFPFSKTSLLLSLEEFYNNLPSTIAPKPILRDFSMLEAKLERINAAYRSQIISAIKEHYGK